MLEVERRTASKTQREFAKGSDFTFKWNGQTFLEIEKWYDYHITRWLTDLTPEDALKFKESAKKRIAIRYHRIGIGLVYDSADPQNPFFQITSRYDLSEILPELLSQSCIVRNLPLEEIKKELRAKYATYHYPGFR